MALSLEPGTIMMPPDGMLQTEEGGGSLYIMPDGRIVALSESAISMISEMGEAALADHVISEEIADQNDNLDNSVMVPSKNIDENTILVSGASVETLLLGNVDNNEDVRIAIEENGKRVETCDELHFEDFVEVVTTYKCKGCQFSSGEREVLFSHIKEKHINRVQVDDRGDDIVAVEYDNEEIADKANDAGVCEIEVCPEQSINGLSIIVNENDHPSPSMFNASSLDNTNVTITKKISDPKLGTHYRIFVQNENREMFVCGQCSACFGSQERILEHLGQLSCFTPVCPHCNADFSGSVSDRIGYLKHVETCNKDSLEKKTSIIDFKNILVDDDVVSGNHLLESEDISDAQETKDEPDERSLSLSERRQKMRELEADHHKRVLECSVKCCTFTFKHVEQLRYHISCHVEESNDFKCIECDQKFEKWRDLATHLWRLHALDCDMLLCGHCRNYRTMYPKILESHNQTHQNLKLYKCDVCDKRFNQISQLKNHAVIHIDKSIAEVPSWAKPKQCEICQKMFSDSKSLKKHVQAIHSKLKPYICQVCGHQSARKAMLQLHVRQHTGEKPFNCDQCEYKTGDHNSLRRHKRRHTGDKPYKCPYCQYAAIQSSSFKSHLKSKHPERPQVDLKGEHVEGGGPVLGLGEAMLLPGVVLVGLDEKDMKTVTSIKSKDGNIIASDAFDGLIAASERNQAEIAVKNMDVEESSNKF
eukprot:TRINITY_DN33322_c0_g1_i1.p1 TRINITY_DN33322_c0_g1~~TRINITY_DN33322_c0_g1_i1.p1  ORF type:complete len:705 (-),score=180.96 TRINITY_DN33322_c0_g1_i1:52-2166(-)